MLPKQIRLQSLPSYAYRLVLSVGNGIGQKERRREERERGRRRDRGERERRGEREGERGAGGR